MNYFCQKTQFLHQSKQIELDLVGRGKMHFSDYKYVMRSKKSHIEVEIRTYLMNVRLQRPKRPKTKWGFSLFVDLLFQKPKFLRKSEITWFHALGSACRTLLSLWAPLPTFVVVGNASKASELVEAPTRASAVKQVLRPRVPSNGYQTPSMPQL